MIDLSALAIDASMVTLNEYSSGISYLYASSIGLYINIQDGNDMLTVSDIKFV